MDDEARSPGSLDPVRARGPRRRSPWGRRYGRDAHEDGQVGAQSQAQTYAALDLGTNNCRLLVARPTPEGFRVVDAFSRIVRLGEGVSASGQISAAAITRALEALTVCRDKMHNRHVTRGRLIATEACRAAENGMDFIGRVRDRVGLDLEIIDRETEAEFAAIGCAPLVDPQAEGVILFDIGGGSSELVSMGSAAARAGPAVPIIHAWASLPVGVVTLAERHGGINVDRALFEVMVGEVAAYVDCF